MQPWLLEQSWGLGAPVAAVRSPAGGREYWAGLTQSYKAACRQPCMSAPHHALSTPSARQQGRPASPSPPRAPPPLLGRCP
jgi:hypothetical protein